jgi:hypothetical protein
MVTVNKQNRFESLFALYEFNMPAKFMQMYAKLFEITLSYTLFCTRKGAGLQAGVSDNISATCQHLLSTVYVSTFMYIEN